MLRTGRASMATDLDTKSSPTDIVTELDTASERLITDRLLAARPDDGLLGEEGASREGQQRGAVGGRPGRRHRQLPLPAAVVGGVDRLRVRR